MTEIEAKALFEVRQNLANAAITGGMKNVRPSVDAALDMLDTLTDLVIAAAQTEARHAAEMRELKERFSEAIKADLRAYPGHPSEFLAPFIIPAPDPLVEALSGIVPHIRCKPNETAAEAVARQLRAAIPSIKIGEAGE